MGRGSETQLQVGENLNVGELACKGLMSTTKRNREFLLSDSDTRTTKEVTSIYSRSDNFCVLQFSRISNFRTLHKV